MEKETRKEVSFERVLPEKYVKPMTDMISHFTKKTPVSALSPILVAVAVAIVIVLWDRPLDEMVMTAEDKASLKFAAEQIRANPEMVRQVAGIELTRTHLKLLEALAL